MTSSEKRLIAQIAAHESWANTKNRSDRTAPARAARDQKFLDAAGGDPIKAAHLRQAYFARLSLTSARSRRKSQELENEAESAEAQLAEAYEVPKLTPEAAGILALRVLQGGGSE